MDENTRQQAITLYDRFTHEGMERRTFMAEMVKLAGSVAAAELLIASYLERSGSDASFKNMLQALHFRETHFGGANHFPLTKLNTDSVKSALAPSLTPRVLAQDRSRHLIRLNPGRDRNCPQEQRAGGSLHRPYSISVTC